MQMKMARKQSHGVLTNNSILLKRRLFCVFLRLRNVALKSTKREKFGQAPFASQRQILKRGRESKEHSMFLEHSNTRILSISAGHLTASLEINLKNAINLTLLSTFFLQNKRKILSSDIK